MPRSNPSSNDLNAKKQQQRSIFEFTSSSTSPLVRSSTDKETVEPTVKREHESKRPLFEVESLYSLPLKEEKVLENDVGYNVELDGKKDYYQNQQMPDYFSPYSISQSTANALTQNAIQVKKEPLDTSTHKMETEPLSILCPVCNLDLHELDFRNRTDHVDTCLVRVSFADSSDISFLDHKPSPMAPKTFKAKLEKKRRTSCEIIETNLPSPLEKKLKLQQNSNSQSNNSNNKKKKIVKEKERYINTETKMLTGPKIIKPPTKPSHSTRTLEPNAYGSTETRPSTSSANTSSSLSTSGKLRKPKVSRRKEISDLKTMTFPLTSAAKTQNYYVSVDAFNFAPHNIIDKYFLTHFHADHYGGISKKWAYERVFDQNSECDYDDDSKYKKIIYCTVITGKLLTLYFSVDPRFIKMLEMDTRYKVQHYAKDDDGLEIVCQDVEDGGIIELEGTSPGLYVIPITANHCPGAGIFLFESIGVDGHIHRILHCGDFRVNMTILDHPLLNRFSVGRHNIEETDKIDQVYLDTTYMSPTYVFPKQELVCDTLAELFENLTRQEGDPNNEGIDTKETRLGNPLFNTWFGSLVQPRITDFWKSIGGNAGSGTTNTKKKKKKKKFLILVGTYVIGKERLAIAILKRLKCQIYVSNINNRRNKYEILRTYQDPYLDSVLTEDELGLGFEEQAEDDVSDCIVHLVPMNIVGSITELSNYFNHNRYYEYFERCVGLRPTGWSFAQNGKKSDSISQQNLSSSASTVTAELEETVPLTPLEEVIKCMKVRTSYNALDHILSQGPKPQTKLKTGKNLPDNELYRIYSVPYSEHSSFRELAYFVVFFNIGKVIPTVNCSNEFNVQRMNAIIETWEQARRIITGGMTEMDYKLSDELIEQVRQITLDSF